MALRKHKPVPISVMDTESDINTICEILRQIYHKTDNSEIKTKCRIATSMAKSMSKKLRQYKDEASYSDERFWDKKE